MQPYYYTFMWELLLNRMLLYEWYFIDVRGSGSLCINTMEKKFGLLQLVSERSWFWSWGLMRITCSGEFQDSMHSTRDANWAALLRKEGREPKCLGLAKWRSLRWYGISCPDDITRNLAEWSRGCRIRWENQWDKGSTSDYNRTTRKIRSTTISYSN